MPVALISSRESERRRLCTSLGKQQLAAAPRVHQDPWLHDSGPTHRLPCCSFSNLLHGMKVLHRFAEVVSDAASGSWPHTLALHSSPEACIRGLEPFAPLLEPILPVAYQHEYEQHIELWRVSNPGLYSHAEAAYHVHQSYSVEDPSMTRLLVWKLIDRPAREYEVAIAGNILRARPASFEEFYQHFTAWRKRGLYHTLCVAARLLPRAEHWVPERFLHESQDWQELLDEFTRSSFCTQHRLAGICERLADRSPALTNHICSLLDRIAILFRVKSWDSTGEGDTLDHSLSRLNVSLQVSSTSQENSSQSIERTSNEASKETLAFTHSLLAWRRLKSAIEESIPPSLLCHPLCPSAATGRDAWGYPRLDLRIHSLNGSNGDCLYIHSGPLRWVKCNGRRGTSLGAGPYVDRFQDILQRMGDCATCPEMAHLMLSPETMAECLAGNHNQSPSDLFRFLDRQWVIDSMGESHGRVTQDTNIAYNRCIDLLVHCLPTIRAQTFPTPLSILTWRVDCPPRAILYQGGQTALDPRITPPHNLIKVVTQHKVPNKTISGICILSDTEDSHTSLRACVAQSILGKYPDFSHHPFNHLSVASRGNGQRQAVRSTTVTNANTMTTTMTTLAESLALFTGPAPPRHSEVHLHDSNPWAEDYIDDRYAETQRADNGLRYRDWLTMFRSFDDLQRSRLAAHHVFTDQLFHTHFPVIASNTSANHGDPDSNQACTWVSVASTLPAEMRVLRQTTGKTPTDALKGSVVGRFINDLKLLPVWNHEDVIDPVNVEVYSDEDSKQVAIVYAPRAGESGERRRLEMISFRLCA